MVEPEFRGADVVTPYVTWRSDHVAASSNGGAQSFRFERARGNSAEIGTSRDARSRATVRSELLRKRLIICARDGKLSDPRPPTAPPA